MNKKYIIFYFLKSLFFVKFILPLFNFNKKNKFYFFLKIFIKLIGLSNT